MDRFTFDTTVFDYFLTGTQVLVFSQALETFLSSKLETPAWALHIPQGATTYPAITYQMVKREGYYNLAGPTKLVLVDYKLTSVGPDKNDVDTLDDAIRLTLTSYRGPFGGLYVTGCRQLTRQAGYNATAWGSDMGNFEVASTYRFHYIRP